MPSIVTSPALTAPIPPVTVSLAFLSGSFQYPFVTLKSTSPLIFTLAGVLSLRYEEIAKAKVSLGLLVSSTVTVTFLAVISIFPLGASVLSAFHSRHPILVSEPLIARIGILLFTLSNVSSTPGAWMVTLASLESIPLNFLLKVLSLVNVYVLLVLSKTPAFFNVLNGIAFPSIVSVLLNSVVVCSAKTVCGMNVKVLRLKHIAMDNFIFFEFIIPPWLLL